MAGMGMVLLAGIVVNNGIVLVDFVNQSRAGGMNLREALRAGCHTRLRPILMTAITTILGMLPLALGIGEGSDMQAPMAIVVVSGLFVSTLLTLIVLPAIFIVMEEQLLPKVAAAVTPAKAGVTATRAHDKPPTPAFGHFWRARDSFRAPAAALCLDAPGDADDDSGGNHAFWRRRRSPGAGRIDAQRGLRQCHDFRGCPRRHAAAGRGTADQ
jgi:hypothetical protein